MLNVAQPIVAKDQRVLCIGRTRSGKSMWLRSQYLPIVSQKITIDPKGRVWFPGAHIANTVGELDWEQQNQIFKPGPAAFDMDVYEEVYRQVFEVGQQGGDLTVYLDETSQFSAQQYPQEMRRVLTQGAELNIRHMAATQRPFNIPADLKSQSDHIIIFTSFYSPRDLNEISGTLGMSGDELGMLLKRTKAQYGKHSHLWFETDDSGLIHVRPPVPEWMFKDAA